MKLSVSLSAEDVATLDEQAGRLGLRSRSAAVREAIRLWRHVNLEDDYIAAWEEWDASGEAEIWAATIGDGIA